MNDNNKVAPSASGITLDDLALMIKKGFDEVDNRFKEMRIYVDIRFAAIERRFDAIEKRLDILEAKFDAFEARHEALEKVVIKDHAPRLIRLERKTQII